MQSVDRAIREQPVQGEPPTLRSRFIVNSISPPGNSRQYSTAASYVYKYTLMT